jgi:hypothetical protein
MSTIKYWCLFEFILKVGVEESIVNAPIVSLQSENTNNAKSEVRFKQQNNNKTCKCYLYINFNKTSGILVHLTL